MLDDIKDHDLLVLILAILALHVGYSMYKHYTKPKTQEEFTDDIAIPRAQGDVCADDHECESSQCTRSRCD